MLRLAILFVAIGIGDGEAVGSAGDVVEYEAAILVGRGAFAALDEGALLAPQLHVALLGGTYARVVGYGKSAQAQGDVLAQALSAQGVEAVANAIALHQRVAASGEGDVLGALSHEEAGLRALCLAMEVGDVGYDGVAAGGILVGGVEGVYLERNGEASLLVGDGSVGDVLRGTHVVIPEECRGVCCYLIAYLGAPCGESGVGGGSALQGEAVAKV